MMNYTITNCAGCGKEMRFLRPMSVLNSKETPERWAARIASKKHFCADCGKALEAAANAERAAMFASPDYEGVDAE